MRERATPTNGSNLSGHILVVGSGAMYPVAAKSLQQEGARWTVICKTTGLARVTATEGLQRVIAFDKLASKSEIVRTVRSIHAIQPISGVLCFMDSSLDLAARIADALNLPWHTPGGIETTHNKNLMRGHLARLGLETIPHAIVKSASDVSAFASEYGFPIILKPAVGTASVGVSKISESAQIPEAYSRATRPVNGIGGGDVHVERFLEGRQFSLEAFTESGEHRVIAITQKYSEPHLMIELGHSLPAVLEPGVQQKVVEYGKTILDALGVTVGPSCIEIVLTDSGPRIFECQLRIAGDETPELLKSALDVDIVSLTVRQALGQSVLAEIDAKLGIARANPKAAAIWFAYPNTDGTLVETRGGHLAQAAQGVLTVHNSLHPGDSVKRLDNCNDRYAAVIATGPDAHAAAEVARRAAQEISFVVEVRGDNATYV